MSELVIESRYIHTGNSGVTILVERHIKHPTKAVLKIQNGSMGAFSTEMEVRGEDYNGFTANQLRDLALVFLESAEVLDQIKAGKDPSFMYEREQNPSIVSANETGYHTAKISRRLIDHLTEEYEKKEIPNAFSVVNELVVNSETSESGFCGKDGDKEVLITTVDSTKNITKAKKEQKPRIDKHALVRSRIKHLAKQL